MYIREPLFRVLSNEILGLQRRTETKNDTKSTISISIILQLKSIQKTTSFNLLKH